MEYIKVQWLHDHADEPIWLYSELDQERWETRKVEVFRNGSIGFADATEEVGPTWLGELPTPPLAEIASDPEFVPLQITREEFEQVWAKRHDRQHG